MLNKISRDLLLSSTDKDCQSFYFYRSRQGYNCETSGQGGRLVFSCHK